MGGVRCTGLEGSLSLCPHKGFGVEHWCYESAEVICKPTDNTSLGENADGCLIYSKLVEWNGYETQQTTKKITMLLCFMLGSWLRAVMIFCSSCDASLDYWPFPYLHLKTFFNLCSQRRHTIIQQ